MESELGEKGSSFTYFLWEIQQEAEGVMVPLILRAALSGVGREGGGANNE